MFSCILRDHVTYIAMYSIKSIGELVFLNKTSEGPWKGSTQEKNLWQRMEGERVKEGFVDARISKILALRTDSIAMTEALEAIGEFYVSNTLDARQSLRQNLEKRTIEYGKKFLQEMESIRVKLDTVDDYSSHLYQSCKALAARVEEADRNIKSFMDQANELEAKRSMYLTQSEEVELFLSKYHLNDSEIQLLQNARLDIVNEARSFYSTFTKLQQAYQDCKVITEKQFYGIGFELLEVLGKHQETAYEKLFFWFKSKCEALAEDTSQLTASQQGQYAYLYSQLQTAARLLQQLPSYREQCQELLIEARRTSFVQQFMIVALQGFGHTSTTNSSVNTSNNSKIVPPHGSGDSPVQFLGGLLAWMHQAVAIETEFFEAIYPKHVLKKKTSETAESVSSSDHVPGYTLEELLVRTVQGVGRPLRMRILQLLETHVSSWDILYALADLLLFYQQLFARSILSSENAIHATLKGCFQECERLLNNQIRRHVESLKNQSTNYLANMSNSSTNNSSNNSNNVSMTMELHATVWTRECALQLKALLKSASLALSTLPLGVITQNNDSNSDNNSSNNKNNSVSQLSVSSLVGEIVAPCLQACRVAGQTQSLSSAEMAVFMLNNIAALQVALTDYKAAITFRSPTTPTSSTSVTSVGESQINWQDMLQQEATSWTSILTSEEVTRILQRSDLDKLVELIDSLPSGLVASEQFGLDADRVATILRAFYASLFSTILCPELDKITDPVKRDDIRHGITQEITTQYAKVYRLVTQPEHQYGDTTQMLQHTVESVQLLLGNI